MSGHVFELPSETKKQGSVLGHPRSASDISIQTFQERHQPYGDLVYRPEDAVRNKTNPSFIEGCDDLWSCREGGRRLH